MSEKNREQDVIFTETMSWMEDERAMKTIAILKPKFSKDGDKFCYLLGENLQEGIAGFGSTVYEACYAFYKAFYNEKAVAEVIDKET